MTRTIGRVPLRPRNINVEKVSSSSSTLSKASFLPLTKKGSSTYERQQSFPSVESSHNDNNKGFDGLSSDTLRRAVSSGSIANGNNDNGDFSTMADTGQILPSRNPSSEEGVKKAPQPPNLRNTSTSKPTKETESSEPVTIIEHRKRPCGDGHTVHKYLRGKLLGKGGFAKVYKVTSLDTNKEYAVKIVPKANLVKTRARQKLQTEIKIHRTMKHANICEYKHFFEDKTNCYILLELCHNQSMNEVIKRRKNLTEEEARFFMMQIIEAVSYMHEANVIHRDLKLGNLFLNKHLNIKVGDFGLATKLDSSDEKRKTICGTPNYIAPEVIDGNKEKRGHSFEVDVWSMGVICFTMLVGKPPYEASDVKSTYRRILANEYSFPQGMVSNDARALISSMLQTDPKMRPSLDEMRNHPFFVLGKIPSSLPGSCTVTSPIWATDEFGELYASKPTSALEITVSNQPPKTQVAKKKSESALKRIDNILHPHEANTETSKTNSKKTATKKVTPSPQFNIYDDLDDRVECKLSMKLPSQSSVVSRSTVDTQVNVFSSNRVITPVNKLSDQMAVCCFDEVRDRPPPQSLPTESEKVIEPEQDVGNVSPECQGSDTPCPAETPRCQTVVDDLCELELMHDRLNVFLEQYERIQKGGCKINSPPTPLKDNEVWGATKWVTRYVDYTSKYGLGFLLNDGSSGVYFNDSTKAVLSSVGENFLYVERRKANADGNREPISEYTLSNYPEESLKKKVTLLQHFRSYLAEQQKRAEEAGEVEPLNSNFDERQDTNEVAMVYMKKWIRTKHAMLFRLSNGTVQVLFYDLTEVLISSEGKLITYVDKEKNRYVHSIMDIANKQQSDISRRLKYAKEILSQLISGSKR